MSRFTEEYERRLRSLNQGGDIQSVLSQTVKGIQKEKAQAKVRMFEATPAGSLSKQALDFLPSKITATVPKLTGPRIGLSPSSQTAQSAQPIAKADNAMLMQRNPSIFERIGNVLSDVREGVLPGAAQSPIGKGINSLIDRGWQSSYETAQKKGQLPYGVPTSINPYTSFIPENKAQSVGQFIGRNIADIPLWLAGDAILAKPLSKLAGSTMGLKVANQLPKAIQPALSTGVRAGTTYGGIVAPVETLVEGDGLRGLVEREKQVPLMALGGVALHGGGQLLGKGISGARNALTDRQIERMIETKGNIADDVQNAYRNPIRETQKINRTLPDVLRTDTAEREAAKSIGLGWDNMNYLQKEAIRRIVRQQPEPPVQNEMKLLPAGQDFTVRDVTAADRFKQMGVNNDQPLLGPGKPQPKPGQIALQPAQGFTTADPYIAKTQIPKTEFERSSSDYPQTIFESEGRPLKKYKVNNDLQKEIAEVEARLTEIEQGAATMVKQANKDTKIDSLVKRVREKGGIAPSKTGAFASEYKDNIPATFKNKNGRPLDEVADELGMSARELIDAIVKNPKAKPKSTGTGDVFSILNNDAEYSALAELLETLKAQMPGKKPLPIRKTATVPETPAKAIQAASTTPQRLTKTDLKLKPRELEPKPEPIVKSIRKRPENGKISPPQRLALPPGQDFVLQGEPYKPGVQVPKTNFDTTPIQPSGFKTQIPKTEFDRTPIPTSGFKQTVAKPRIYDNSSQGLSPQLKRMKDAVDDANSRFNSPIEGAKPIEKAGQTQPIQPPKPVADTKQFWTSVRKELNDKGEMTPLSVELLKREIKDGKVDISKLGNADEVRTLLGMDLTKFGKNTANAYETPLVGLPESQSKIVIGKKKEGLGFKESLKKFYTKTVNTQQPIVDAGKVDGSDIGKLASNTRNVSGIVDYNFTKGMVNKNGDKVGESLKSVVEVIPKGKEKDFWSYMSHRHNIARAGEGKPVQANYTPEMSAKAVKQFEAANSEYKVIGDGIVKWIDDFMQTWGVDTGIVNKELYRDLRNIYPDYFPTQRDFSTLEKAIPDNVSQKFADQRTPIRKAKGSERDIIDPTENIMNLVNRTIRTAKYNEVGQSLLDSVRTSPEKMKPLAEVIKTKDGMFSNKDNVISVLEDGKPVYLQINDKMLLDAMNGLPKTIGEIPVLSTLTNTFKHLVTQSNPLFAIRNIARDLPTSYVYGSEANPFKFLWQLGGAGKDIITQGPRLQKYKAVGGGGANFFNRGDVTKSVAEITGKGSKLKKAVTAPLRAIQYFNNMTETAPRLAEFNRVLNKTGDVNKALAAANDVTVNFSRSGNVTKSIDRGVPYLNAGVQGLDKFFRGFKDPKTALQTIVKSGVAITTPTLALYMINKDDPNYQALDNRTKDTYFLIPNGDGTFTKLPKSRELGVLFGSLFERGLRVSGGQDNSLKGFGNTVKTNFAPANPFDSNFFAPATWNMAINKDFAKRAIVPQSMLMDKRPDYLQYDEKTTKIAKAIGEITKGMPGNKDGISPKRLDYLIKSYSGIIGQIGIPLATPGGNVGKSLSIQFKADPVFSNQTTTDFYDKLDKLSSTATEKNITQQIPSKKLTPEEDIKNSMNAISTAIARGTKKINALQASRDSAQIREIKTLQLELMRKGVMADTPKSMQKVENEAKKLWKK